MARIFQQNFTKIDDFVESAVRVIINEYHDFLASSEGKPFLLGLSGGKTPEPIYRALAGKLDWDNCQAFVIDERNVPRNNQYSNYRMIEQALFPNAGMTEQPIPLHDFRTDLPPDDALHHYAYELEREAPNAFDLLILGAGPDGHFASIFPGFRDWNTTATTCRSLSEDFVVRERFSLTPSYLYKSRKVLLLLSGRDKLPLLEELNNGTKVMEEFPLKFWANHPGLGILYCEV